MDYQKYYLQWRKNYKIQNHSGRLFQQYCVDLYARIEQIQSQFLRFKQMKIRAELYHGLHDRIINNNESRIGKRISDNPSIRMFISLEMSFVIDCEV